MNTTKQKTFRILPGYSHITKARTVNDDCTGCVAVAVGDRRGDEALYEVYTDEGKYLTDYWFKDSRLQVY